MFLGKESTFSGERVNFFRMNGVGYSLIQLFTLDICVLSIS